MLQHSPRQTCHQTMSEMIKTHMTIKSIAMDPFKRTKVLQTLEPHGWLQRGLSARHPTCAPTSAPATLSWLPALPRPAAAPAPVEVASTAVGTPHIPTLLSMGCLHCNARMSRIVFHAFSGFGVLFWMCCSESSCVMVCCELLCCYGMPCYDMTCSVLWCCVNVLYVYVVCVICMFCMVCMSCVRVMRGVRVLCML